MVSRTLNARQVDILQRLAAGETITRRDTDLAVTIYALRNRGLVSTIKGEGRTWTAEITDAGRRAAQTGTVPRQVTVPKGRARATPRPTSAAPATREPVQPRERTRPPEVVIPPRRPARGVRRDVLAATRAALKGRADDRGLLHAAGSSVVTVSVSRDQRSRALSLVDQVLAEAEARGMSVALVTDASPWARVKPAQVQIMRGELGFTFSVTELTSRTPHTPTAAELARQAKFAWDKPPEWDYHPNGLLRLDLGREHTLAVPSARSRFADGSTARAESKVSGLLDEVVRRADAELERRAEELRLDALYAEARVQAVQGARERFWEDLRAAEATAQAARWAAVQQLRTYAAQMRARAPGQPNDWLDWIESHADALDPLDRQPTGPDLPADPREWSDLAPYLRGWPDSRPYDWRPRD